MSDPTVLVLHVPTYKLVVERILPIGNASAGPSAPVGTGPVHASGGVFSVGPINAATEELTGLGPVLTTAIGAASIAATQVASGVLDVARLPAIPIASGTSGTLDLASRVSGVLPAANGGASTPSGTGFPHVTGGVRDGAARAVDLSSADVTGVLGAGNVPTLPIDTKTSGLLDLTTRVTGVLPAANGGAAAPSGSGFAHVSGGAYDSAARAVNLASSDVTGVLATGNQAAQALAGDVTGTTAAASVVAVRGIAISATAPTGAGQVLTSTGTAGAAWATPSTSATYESLPVWLAASSPLFAQADVATASATGARTTLRAQNATGATSTGGEMRVQSGTGTTAAGAVTTYAGATKVASFAGGAGDFIAVGLNPATTGGVRTANNTAWYSRNAANTTDLRLIVLDGANQVQFGDSSAANLVFNTGGGVFVRNSGFYLQDAAGVYTGFVISGAGASGAIRAGAHPTMGSVMIGWSGDQTAASTNGKLTTIQGNNATGTTSTGGEMRVQSGTGTTAAGVTTLYAGATERLRAETAGVSILGGAGSYGGAAGALFIANATTTPTSNPSGGGVLYVEGGALKYRGSSGTVTVIAPA